MLKNINPEEMISLILCKHIDEEIMISLLKQSELDENKLSTAIKRVRQRTQSDVDRICIGGKEFIHRIV